MGGRAWRVISLVGDPDPHLLDDVDPAKAAAFPVEEAKAYQEASLVQQLRWTVVAAPNPGWATEVFGEPDVERLWEAVGTAMRLDKADPVASWQQRKAELGARGRALDALELTEVRYPAPAPISRSGSCRAPSGPAAADRPGRHRVHAEHPDRGGLHQPRPAPRRRHDQGDKAGDRQRPGGRRAEGHVLRPAITEVTAASGAEVVRAQVDTDEGARSLGEVSLVDREAGSRRPASSSRTRCSTRTPAATSHGGRASRSRSRAAWR